MWLISLCAVFIIGIIGCGGDEDDAADGNVNAIDWVGTWKVETFDGEGYEQFFVEDLEAEFGVGVKVSIVAHRVTFNDDGTLEWVFAFKTTGKKGDLDDSGTLSLIRNGRLRPIRRQLYNYSDSAGRRNWLV